MAGLSPGGLTPQHRALLLILGLAMIGGRVPGLLRGEAGLMDWLIMALGGVVLFVSFLAGRAGSGR